MAAFDEDTVVEIQALKIQIDPRIIDRFDNFIHAINAVNKRKEEARQFGFSNIKKERR